MAFNNTQIGTKGSDVYTVNGVNDPRVALSALLVQGCDPSIIQSGMDAILQGGDMQMVEDLFVLLFQTRDIRGGKGIRDVALQMEMYFLEHPTYKPIMIHLLDLIPEYGCWRDLFVLLEKSLARKVESDINEAIIALVRGQLEMDETNMAEGKSISLLAKWLPREGSYGDGIAKYIANQLYFPTLSKAGQRMKAYRKRVATLNRYIQTIEIKMCAKQFAEIEPAKVPGRALQKYTKAFLNETLGGISSGSVYRPVYKNGVRYPNDPDRVACAEHFTEHFAKAARGEAKINGSKTVYPHELMKKIVNSIGRDGYYSVVPTDMSFEEKNALIGVWNQMVKELKEGGGLGRSLAMCDFSGSMQSSSNGDTPYWVSMAMGLLISEVATDEFQDVFLTFDSNPTLHCLPKGDIFERVESIQESIGQGTSTDFQKAMELVLQRCKQMRVKPGQEPEYLIVLTDMNWDEACGSNEASYYTGNRYRHVVKTDEWQTHVEMIRESFKRAGEDMWGEGLKMPTIVIWNIAASSTDFHATADTPGVIMMSGWSPTLFKVLQTQGIQQWTPYQALRIQLDNERYDPVRARVREFLVDVDL
jgi:hypothetical protein